MNDELLIKFLLKETGPDEDLLVQEWIAADPANRKHFAHIETIWEASQQLTPRRNIDPGEAWLKFKERRDAKTSPAKVVPMRTFTSYWLRIAAVLLIAAAGMWSVYTWLQPGYTTLASALEVKTGMLPDGSTITLNKNSVVSYPKAFDEGKRVVELEQGEVFFDVQPDKAQPFVINADDVTVTVMGTSFNVKHSETETDIIVETGVVSVEKGKQKVILRAGEKVNVGPESGTLQKEKITDRLHNYYRSKEFVADNTPLWRMVDVLNEAYQANIQIGNPALKNLTLTTTFKNESLDQILTIIGETFDITVEKKGDKIILR